MSEYYELTEEKYGFAWGPVHVERTVSGPFGVVITIMNDRGRRFEVRVSPRGQLLEVVRNDFDREVPS